MCVGWRIDVERCACICETMAGGKISCMDVAVCEIELSCRTEFKCVWHILILQAKWHYNRLRWSCVIWGKVISHTGQPVGVSSIIQCQSSILSLAWFLSFVIDTGSLKSKWLLCEFWDGYRKQRIACSEDKNVTAIAFKWRSEWKRNNTHNRYGGFEWRCSWAEVFVLTSVTVCNVTHSV